MKEWPKDGSIVSFVDLVEPLHAAVMQMNPDLHKQNWSEPDSYDGYNVGALHVCLPADEQLAAENLERQEQDQGRDTLNVILSVAVQLGIEQGRRLERQELTAKHNLEVLAIRAQTGST